MRHCSVVGLAQVRECQSVWASWCQVGCSAFLPFSLSLFTGPGLGGACEGESRCEPYVGSVVLGCSSARGSFFHWAET